MYIKSTTIVIMLGVHKHETFREMAENAAISIATVHERLQELVEDKLVSPPARPGLARAYSLTAKGKEILEANIPNLINPEETNVENWDESYISVAP